jgi:formamidopyrimidine-DNA glycosylase
MPELPDVEFVRRRLDGWLRGARIVDARANDRIVVKGSAKSFAERLEGRTITRLGRRGKWLRIEIDDGTLVFGHLGMTGDFTRDGSDRFERARLEVERRGKRATVRYVDARRLGRLVIAREDISTWTKLGPDPLLDGIDARALHEKLGRRSRRSVKEVLMDQTVLAGIGNIHAIEALWKARIDPRSNAAALDAKDVAAIVSGLRWTIQRALADLAKGDDEVPPQAGRQPEGPKNGEDNPFRVYGRKGTPCPRCKTRLERVELGGRTTTFCPGCQVLRKARRRS